ncbi:phosphoglycolate phosphatase [Amphritea japonica]|uniref:Phosphoglycolate phosphatase n=1 Tax=Amphritea japonica ATCC BAA-1530 TaxID=1278309 RepID=A0A7R6P3K4_9GAMM|nr:phosphoglycolate phosphatase [Amphritea japonica]BBB25254.1 phosphoglycolate phosphatase [Amphritea japonica ATCC BAA-1530]
MKELFKGEFPRLVLFDLDGTLLDSVPDLALAVDRMLAAMGMPEAGEGRVRNWVGNGAQMLVKRALTGLDSPVGNEPELVLLDRAYELFLEHYGTCCSEKSRLYPGVIEVLTALQAAQVNMGLVTNKPLSFTDALMGEFSLNDYFSITLGGDSLAEKKPHPLPLLHAMEVSGVSPEHTLMVGDSRSDIKAAQAAGCKVAAVTYGYNHGEPVARYAPDLIIDNLKELIN